MSAATRSFFPLAGLLALLLSTLTGCQYSGTNYTVNINSAKSGNATQYSFDQGNKTVLMNDSVTFTNNTDEDQTLVGQPDGAIPANSVVPKHQSLTISFTKVGTWTISSKAHPDLKMTVVVQGGGPP